MPERHARQPCAESSRVARSAALAAALLLLAAASGLAQPSPALDCADLWEAGFPSHGFLADLTSFPCEPVDAGLSGLAYPGQLYRSTLPRAGTDPLGAEGLQDLLGALEHSSQTFAKYGTVPEMAVILVDEESPRLTSAATAFLGHARAEEPCPVIVWKANAELDLDRASQTVAHEVYHCFQWANFGVSETLWWVEGTAEYFSNVAYPSANWEHAETVEYSQYATPEAANYGSAALFQALVNQEGFDHAALMELQRRLISDISWACVLATWAGMPELFHEFGQGFAQRFVADTGGWLHRAQRAELRARGRPVRRSHELQELRRRKRSSGCRDQDGARDRSLRSAHRRVGLLGARGVPPSLDRRQRELPSVESGAQQLDLAVGRARRGRLRRSVLRGPPHRAVGGSGPAGPRDARGRVREGLRLRTRRTGVSRGSLGDGPRLVDRVGLRRLG